MLPIKKIYIDTRHKTSDSVSTSNFHVQLTETFYMPENAFFQIDDVSIPYSWYTIEKDFNDLLYMLVDDVMLTTTDFYVLQMAPGVYSGYSLASQMSTRLQSITQGTFTAVYNTTRNDISISCDNVNVEFRVLTNEDLKTRVNNTLLPGDVYDVNNTFNMNDILGNTEGVSPRYTFSTIYTTKYLDLHPVRNIYISSPSFGSFSTLGSNGESNIIKKVPVTSNPGEMIYSSVTSSYDYLNCSKQLLRNLHFQLKDVKGNYINLHGANVSFSLIFDLHLDK